MSWSGIVVCSEGNLPDDHMFYAGHDDEPPGIFLDYINRRQNTACFLGGLPKAYYDTYSVYQCAQFEITTAGIPFPDPNYSGLRTLTFYALDGLSAAVISNVRATQFIISDLGTGSYMCKSVPGMPFNLTTWKCDPDTGIWSVDRTRVGTSER